MLDQTTFERLTTPQPWPEAEVARLMHLRLELGWGWPEIALELGRTESGVKSKLKYEQFSKEVRSPSIPFVREPIPKTVLAEQSQRIIAWGERSLTASLMGDPPVKFSALGKRS